MNTSYESYFENHPSYVKFFKETVLHVNRYFEVIIKDFVKFIDTHKESDFKKDDTFFIELEKHMTKYNIKFLYYSEVKDAFIYEGGLGRGGKIGLFCSYHKTYKSVLNIFSNPKAKQELIDDFRLICQHELVHRAQLALNRVAVNKNPYEGEEKKDEDYFSTPEEIMAYAYHTIEECRIKGYHDNQIKNLLTSKNSLLNISLIYAKYNRLFNNPKYRTVFNKYQKYVYQYLVDPVKKELEF